MDSSFTTFLVLLVVSVSQGVYLRLGSSDVMKCSYGERGSLTATCENATVRFFKDTPYRFDHLDETVRCINCSLQIIETGSFDLSGNQIKNMDLTACKINTIRQKAFVGLIFLEKLILANNEIKAIFPGAFSGVKKISEIDLRNNAIASLYINGFLELVQLKTLNLRNNVIKTIEEKAFNGLVSLETLDLSNNQLSEIKSVFNDLTSLKILDLTSNRISSLDNTVDFLNLTSLLELRLNNNLIKTIPSHEFGDLTSLRRLDLSFNLISQFSPASFRGLVSLESLDISLNNISEIPLKTLQNLYQLHSLNISNNKITSFQTGMYSGLPQLRMLNISHNAISEIEVTGVFSLHSLHTLDLSYNNITDVDYPELVVRLPRLSYLSLTDNLLPCDLEEEMQAFFAEDNFKFLMFRNVPGAVECVENTRNNSIRKYPEQNKLVVHHHDDSVDHSSGHVWLTCLICITMVLVGILFYLQFRTFKELRASGGFQIKHSVSKVQLLGSSDMDNEQLKE